jgi:homoserine O-acetyltransferase
MLQIARTFVRQRRASTQATPKSWQEDEKDDREPQYDTVSPSGYRLFRRDAPLHLEFGGVLSSGFELAYETWGTLNSRRDNAILLHTGLSASSHAKSHELNKADGWWERFIGSGGVIDTDKFFVICTNVLGGCYGSTGPSSVDRATGKRYASSFPLISVVDMIHAQFLLLDELGVARLHASVGASLGGMQSLCAATLYPDRVARVASMSACARTAPSAVAHRYTQRRVLMSDPAWNGGDCYDDDYPAMGMQLARQLATISYRSGPEWERRFARKRVVPHRLPSPHDFDFAIESYLEFQGRKFSRTYDPNSLLYISKAMDLFDLGAPIGGVNEPSDLTAGLSRVTASALVLGIQSDILFPCWQQKEIADHLRAANKCAGVTYYELDSLFGHDSFLLDFRNVGAALKGHLELDLN